MKILDAKVNWNDGFMNSPDLQILVDEIPDWDSLRFERRAWCFAAYHPDGYVGFLSGDPEKPGHGYGGDAFNLTMLDGSTVKLIGPWSSRAGAVNSQFPERPVMDVDLIDDPVGFKRGHTFSSGAITVELALQAAHLAGVELIRIPSGDEMPKEQWKASLTEGQQKYYWSQDMGPHWEVAGKEFRPDKVPVLGHQVIGRRKGMKSA